MRSVTADSNIYISALQFGGVPARFLDLALMGEFRLDITGDIRDEVLRVLRDKFHWTPADLPAADLLLTTCARLVDPMEVIDIIKADPDDNRILEYAVAAQSDYIVTGDKQHILPLRNYRGMPIQKVADFLKKIEEEASHA